ncbi:hypothetical protein O7627_02540 [Solwaraspora sp. WMMD1047]|uniref:WD40/YVTN/BNR-like repeat-containing protein n=1 Tax=Solwaraspora sp. WMMD1047 TaxID=3016102 RepID=UPI002415DC77|nr:hypothetical protein [Solwaraspora sp. WMMD1047]MDG4828181.1 hypothetical protein [Solwaraspora sp. WMMD1047]
MSDPDTCPARFRASAFDAETIGRTVRQPPLDDLQRSATKRRRRRVSAAALTVVVGLLGVVIVPLAAGPGANWTGPKPTVGPPARDGVSDLIVLDATTAVAVIEYDWCGMSFAVTHDRGVTWSDWRQFDRRAACRRNEKGDFASDVRYHPLDARTFLVSIDGSSYLSRDAGQTWLDADSSITTVDAFPPSAVPVACQVGCHGVPEPLAVDPVTAAVYRLRGEPPSPHKLMSMYVSWDGTLWASYYPGAIDKSSVIARSADRGATWRSFTAPEGTNTIGVAASDYLVAYLLVEPRPDPASQQGGDRTGIRSRLLRTTDGGRNWEEITTDLPSTSLVRPFTLGLNQSLLVGDIAGLGGVLWTSRDGGRHFERGPVTTAAYFSAAPGRIWLMLRDEALVSIDGINWDTLPLPG